MLKTFATLMLMFSTITALSFSCFHRMNRVASACDVSSFIPVPLFDMKRQAEDIFDSVSEKNWKKVNQDLNAINNNWITFQDQNTKDGIPPSLWTTLFMTVENLNRTYASRNVLATMQAVNDIYYAIVEFLYFYQPDLPIDVEYLTIFEQQLLVDVLVKNWNGIEQSLFLLNEVWRRVKPWVSGHINYFKIIEFSDCLENQNTAFKARDAKALLIRVQHGLDMVHTLKMNLKLKA